MDKCRFVRYRLNFLTRFVASLCWYSACVAANPHKTYPYNDWVSAPCTHKICHGYYLQQPLPFPGMSEEALRAQPLSVTADEGQFIPEGDSTLIGHVHLIDGNRQLFADKAIVHCNANQQKVVEYVQVEGYSKLTEPDLRLEGMNAKVFVQTDTQTIQDANFRLYNRHARGLAKDITVFNKTKMALQDATYTTCNPFQNTWVLRAKRVDLNKKTGRGQARHARLYVKDIPVFYMPYVDFPIDDRRQTGFLYPTFGNSNRSGMELGTPFYWNIAPNYDATITPRVLTKRGLELQGQFRYLSPTSQGELDGAFLPNDRAYQSFRRQKIASHPLIADNDPRVSALNTNNDRKAFLVKHRTSFNDRWSTNLHYQTVHDDNYFMHFGDNIGLVNTTQLLQQGDLLYQDTHWSLGARVQQYQTLHPFEGPVTGDVYKRLPQLTARASYPDLPLGLQWDVTSEFSRFAHKPDPFTGNPFTRGDRFHIRPGLSLPIVTPGWYITPRIQWDFLTYALSVGPNDISTINRQHPQRTAPMFDLDSGLIFERSLSLYDERYIQTLEPRVYYLYVPFRNQVALPNFDTGYSGFDYNQLYRDNRFAGFDRLGDANQVTLGVSSRLFAENTGTEKLTVTLGQIFYFKDRQVHTCAATDFFCLKQQKHRRSSMVGTARYSLQEDWYLSGNVEWDPYEKRTDKQGVALQYHPSDLSVFNIGYQFLRRNPAKIDRKTGLPERLRQTDTSFAWPITEQWRLLGRWHYDVRNRISNDISMGIEQQGCCTIVRLLATRFLQPFDDKLVNRRKYTNAVFLQFVFKGFTGVGNNQIHSTLKRAIPRYRWRDDEF